MNDKDHQKLYEMLLKRKGEINPFSYIRQISLLSQIINARAETIHEKPNFRTAFKTRRCLIIADGFYEWKTEGRKKTPLYFYLKSGEPTLERFSKLSLRFPHFVQAG